MYYEGGTVYYGDEEIASADEYAEQAQAIATDLPDVNADDLEWLPLGVFALTQDGQSSGPDPTIFLQLAISNMQLAISDHAEPFNHREDMHLSRERAESRVQQWQQELAGIPLGQRVPEGNQELVTSSSQPPLLTTTGKQ